MDYKVELEGRGETLRYAVGDRYLHADVTIGRPCSLSTWCARHWVHPKDVPLSDAEFALAVSRMVTFLTQEGLGPVTIDDRGPETTAEKLKRLRAEGLDVQVADGQVIHRRDQFESAEDVKDGVPGRRRPTWR